MGAPVIHFEVHASDPETLAAFYKDVFGWAYQAAPGMPYTLLFPTGVITVGEGQAEGIGGGMLQRQGPAPDKGAPVNGFVCIFQVEELEAAHAAVLDHGGQIALEPMEVEGVGRVFYGLDPDRNIFGVLQPTPPQYQMA